MQSHCNCVYAVRLQLVAGPVKSSRETRAERTEGRIVAAAAGLFVSRGYRSTTLTDVAAAAGVSDRTIYVRFASKPDLLKRVMDVAVVGDTRPVPLADRDWVAVSTTAPGLDARIAADAAGTTALFVRLAPLLAVALTVEPDEPVIAESARAGRASVRAATQRFWSAVRRDGLAHPDVDVEWVIATCSVLGTPETYLQLSRSTDWTPADYERWRCRTWRHFATTPSQA